MSLSTDIDKLKTLTVTHKREIQTITLINLSGRIIGCCWLPSHLKPDIPLTRNFCVKYFNRLNEIGPMFIQHFLCAVYIMNAGHLVSTSATQDFCFLWTEKP